MSHEAHQTNTNHNLELEVRGIPQVMVEVNCPHIFNRDDFRAYLNDPATRVATWHNGGEPGEFSDVFVTYDQGGGSNSDMPGWDTICKALEREGFSNGVVRLTNIETE